MHIIDMRYPDPFGHEFMYTNAVYDAAVEAGISTVIYGSDISRDNNGRQIVPLFREWNGIIRKNHYAVPKLLIAIYENHFVFKKLNSIMINDIISDNIILFHSPIYRHFPSIYFWYRKLKKKPKLVLILRYSHLMSKDNFKWLKKEFYLNIVKQWMTKKLYDNFFENGVVLGTDSDILAQEFNDAWKIQVIPFPIPIPNQIFPSQRLILSSGSSEFQRSGKKEVLTLISLGPARDDKGSYLLNEAIIGILDQWKGGNLQFVIQTKTPEKGAEKTKRTIGLLSEIGPCVQTFDRSLSQEEYWKIFHQADIVLLPYDTEEYRARTSGIFAEAMALGKHAVIPRGTWMENEVKGMEDTVSLFEGGSSLSLIEAVLKALAFVSGSDQASRSHSRWREKHNAKSFIHILLNLN